MAGKTFGGVGGDAAPSPHIADDDSRPRLIDEDDSRGLHSGPTVVDDQKVAEVLKKLRSLDKPPGPLTGVTEVVVDANSSEPTRIEEREIEIETGPVAKPGGAIAKLASALAKPAGAATVEADSGPASLDEVMYPLKRSTSVGRSLSTPTDGQSVTVPADPARGTMFGRSIHLPEVNAPDAADVELSSGAVHFLDGAPPALQPFPLADRPAVVVPPPMSAPARLHARTPYDIDPHTQLVDPPRSKAFRRFVAFVGGLSLAGAGIWAWWQYGGGRAMTTSPPAATAPAPAATPPAIDPMPPSAAPIAPAPKAPAAAAPAAAIPPPAPTPAATAKAAAPEAEAPAPAAVAEESKPRAPTQPATRSHSRRSARESGRHAAAKSTSTPPPPADDAEPAEASKPGHAHKKPAVAEDPDATMAPSD